MVSPLVMWTAHDPVEPEREEAPVSVTSSEAIPEPSQL